MGRAAAVLFLLLVPFHAPAGDGVLEINAACAAQGCFSGDAAGLPVEIANAGSYRLTSNIALPDLSSGAIFITADNVTVDLNGFEIRGVNTCSFNGSNDLVCTAGIFNGILASSGVLRTEVRNGTVMGATGAGVFLGAESTVRDLRVVWNGSGGIVVGSGSVVERNAVYQNGAGSAPAGFPFAGIEAGQGSRIQGNSCYQNRGDGIDTTDGSLVHGNVVYENDEQGVSVGFRSSVQANTVYRNDMDGINAFDGATISGNTVGSNGEDGIEALTGSAIADNTVRVNGGVGLNLVDHVTYSGNTVTSNVADQVSGGVNQGGNYCVGTGTALADCP